MCPFPIAISVTNLNSFYLPGFNELDEFLIPGTVSIFIFSCPPRMVPEYKSFLFIGGVNPVGW
jgi:hypothetical protein